MKASREMLERQAEGYVEKVRGLNSYIKELKKMTAKHGTEKAQFETALMQAEHNTKYYEGEVARIRKLIDEGPDVGTYRVYEDAAGEWRWQLRAANNQIIADSGEGYRKRQDCLHAIALVKDSKYAPVKEGR